MKHMNDEVLPFKLLSNEWGKVKSKGHLKNVGLLLNLQDKILEIKQIKEALNKKEFEKLEMALQHKSKLCVYNGLKWVVGLEEYQEVR